MTLPSLKKHPITRLSRQVWTASLAGALSLSVSFAQAAEPANRYLQLQSPGKIRLVSQEEAPESSPLDRLKQRSAQQRFQELNNQTPAPLPLEEPAEIEPVSPADFPPPAEQSTQENKLPKLPELNELEEFAPFEQPTEPKLKPVPKRTVKQPKLVPAPAPAQLQYSSISQPAGSARLQATPDAVRSISGIKPSADFNSAAVDEYKAPIDDSFPATELQERLSPDRMFTWEASNLFHNPLYFEDAPLERYGHTHGDVVVQPLLSLSRMSVQLVGLPYQTVIDKPDTKRYTLGWYRPGEAAPHLFYQVPLNLEAAAAEGLAITGAVLIVP